MAKKIYKLKGWAPLKRKIFIIEGSGYHDTDYLEEQVTDRNKIKIYLTPGRCDDDLEKYYHCIYKSQNGFTMGEICTLIFKTYWTALIDVYENNVDAFSNLSLAQFEFDESTGSVYPVTDS